MNSKFFEVRGRGTFWPVIATELGTANVQESKIRKSTGAGSGSVLVCKIDSGVGGATTEAHRWDDPVMEIAATFIEQNFQNLIAGQVIDTDVISGKSKVPVGTQFS